MTDQPVSRDVTLAGRTYTLERITGYKAARLFAIARALGGKSQELARLWNTTRTELEQEGVELDRGAAMIRYGPEPLVVAGNVALYPDEHPNAGAVVMVPGPLDHLTDEAWTAMGNRTRVPRKVEVPELIAAVAPSALEVAEEHIFRLLALVTLENAAVKAAWKGQGLDPLIDERVEDVILEADVDELLELAVVAGELVEDQLVSKLERLGERTGKALRLVGLDPARLTRRDPATSSTPTTSADTPPSSRPTSSTDGDESTDGDQPTPSTPPTSSSPPLAPALSTSEPD